MTNQLGLGSIIGGTASGGAPVGSGSLYAALQALSLTTNLQTCLDAGDPTSYSSGQTWTDLTGNAYSFFRGTTAAVEASDPTFNGSPGSQNSSNYWSVNGSQWFTLNQTNPAWVQQMHKAGATFTIAQWAYLNNITSVGQNFFDLGDLSSSGLSGFDIGYASPLRTVSLQIWNASVAVYTKVTSTSANNNAWNFFAVSVNMSTGNVNFQLNGQTDVYTSQSFSGTPISGNAGGTLQIAAEGSNVFPSSSGCRVASVAMWNTGLSGAQLASIFTATRGKFGV